MISHLITISIIIEGRNKTYILINIGCLAYGAISSRFIKRAGLKCINIPIKKLIEIEEKEDYINKIMKVDINIDKHQQDTFFYIIRDHLKYNLILGKLWMVHYNIKIILKINTFFIYFSGIRVKIKKKKKKKIIKSFKDQNNNILILGKMV